MPRVTEPFEAPDGLTGELTRCDHCHGPIDGTEKPVLVEGDLYWAHPQCEALLDPPISIPVLRVSGGDYQIWNDDDGEKNRGTIAGRIVKLDGQWYAYRDGGRINPFLGTFKTQDHALWSFYGKGTRREQRKSLDRFPKFGPGSTAWIGGRRKCECRAHDFRWEWSWIVGTKEFGPIKFKFG